MLKRTINEVEENEMVEETSSDLHISDKPSCFKPNLKNDQSKSSGSVKLIKYNSKYL